MTCILGYIHTGKINYFRTNVKKKQVETITISKHSTTYIIGNISRIRLFGSSSIPTYKRILGRARTQRPRSSEAINFLLILYEALRRPRRINRILFISIDFDLVNTFVIENIQYVCRYI